MKNNQPVPSGAPRGGIRTGRCDAVETAAFGDGWPNMAQLRPGADDIMVRDLRHDIVCQQEVVEQYRLPEARARLASLREEIATPNASRVIGRRSIVEHERGPPLTASH